MSKRFQNVNKYRNAVGTAAKRENWYAELSLGTSSGSDNAHLVQASCNWLAVKGSGSGGSMVVLPIDKTGNRCSEEARDFYAHGPSVSDWHFSGFDQDLLATGGEDGMVKLWKIPQVGEPTNQTSFSIKSRRVDTVRFHPTTKEIVSTLGNDRKKIGIWDVTKSVSALDINTHSNPFHSFSWKSDGSLLGTSGKDTVEVWDPRASEQRAQSGPGHEGIKGSRIVWLGESNNIFTVGTDKMRNRQYALWDARDLSNPLKKGSMDSSTGITIPLYDEDTETMYLISRGETVVHVLQLSDTATSPTIAPNMSCNAGASLYGGALLPKLALDVMHTEIARVIAVTDNAALPISFNVPRKQYLDFHGDLFPDTTGQDPALSGAEWLDGQSAKVGKVSLDPSKRSISSEKVSSDSPVKADNVSTTVPDQPTAAIPSNSSLAKEEPTAAQQAVLPSEVQTEKNEPNKEETDTVALSATPAQNDQYANDGPNRPTSDSSSAPVKKGQPQHSNTSVVFKYLEGKPYPLRTRYDDLHGLSTDKSGAFELIQANEKFIAISLSGPGGQVGIVPVSTPGRLPTHIPSIQCDSAVTYFTFDPFDHHVISTACVDNRVRLYRIPEAGLDEDLVEPFAMLSDASLEKISFIAFHPTARNVLLIVSGTTIRVWDIDTLTEKITICDVHNTPILGCVWSSDGKMVATVAKDKKIRLIEARTGCVVATGKAHDSIRPSRLLWLGETNRLVSVGFGLGSAREVLLYNTKDLSLVSKTTIDNSPSVMSAHYDQDCKIVFVAGRGERTIHTFRLETDDALASLSVFQYDTLQQGFAFMPKRVCDVRRIEVAKFYRLTPTFIEPVGVRVPRARPEYFQDDLFIDTLDTEHSALESTEWFDGVDKDLTTLSLQPTDMTPLSCAPPPPQKERSKIKFEENKMMVTDDERRQETINRMFMSAKEVEGDNEQATKQETSDDDWDD